MRCFLFLVAVPLIALPCASAAQIPAVSLPSQAVSTAVGTHQNSDPPADGVHSLRLAGGGGLAVVVQPIVRAALVYEYRTPTGFVLAAEGGLGVWIEDSPGVFGLVTPGIKVEFTPRKSGSFFVGGGLTALIESETEIGFNLGAGYDTAVAGPGVRIEGRVHLLGEDSDGGRLFLAELMLSIPIL